MVRFLHGTNQTETSSRTSSRSQIIHKDRRNGWSCPWHPLQLIAWFFLCFFAVTYFGIIVSYLPREWRPAAYIVSFLSCFILLYFSVHILFSNCITVFVNDKEKSLRILQHDNQLDQTSFSSFPFLCASFYCLKIELIFS